MYITLYGPESFLAERKLKEIVENYKKTQKSGLSLSIFKSEDFDFNDFKSALETVSMFNDKKLMIFKNFFIENAEDAKKILDFAKKADTQDSKDIVMVFFESGQPKATKEFKELLKKPNLSQEFLKMEGAKLNSWIQKEFDKLGAKIETRAVLALIQATGNDLYRLKNEIDKLAAYLPAQAGKKSINEKDVLEMVVSDFHADIFTVIDAIAKKDKKLSFKILNDHIEHGESEIYLLTMIIYQFRNLIKIKSLIDKSLSEAEIVKKTGLHPFVVKKTLSVSRQFSFEELKNIYQKLFDIDLKIKTGEIEPKIALNMFIIEL